MSAFAANKKPAAAGFLLPRLLLVYFVASAAFNACAQDYEREQRWADDITATLLAGEAVWLTQARGHRFLTLYTEPAVGMAAARGAVIIAHGRGWSPDFELYGTLRARIAELGYSTLSIQMPVLPSTAKLGDYKPVYPDASERLQLAADFLKRKGYRNIAIVSHSLGATMTNQYLIHTDDDTVKAWVFIGIVNGLEEMFRIKIRVLDIFGSKDWEVTVWGADERRKQILKNPGSAQVIVPDAEHFFEGKEALLSDIIVKFLDGVFASAPTTRVQP